MSQHEHGTTEETAHWSSESSDEEVRDLTGATLGDFQVKRLLGRGGMGEVYLANQISLNRLVAIKVLHPRFLSKPAYLSRFEAEATAVAKLNHPNIVHVYTLGKVDEVRFIAMEYVEGTNLREYINKKGALELPLALSIMRQAGAAIGAAGEVGLVHRDIKPENLLLTRKGRVKVADFGLCREQGAERLHITQPGMTMGTPLYMSPEQAQGRPLDHRSDLYSLGVTFYHMLCGEPPFRAESAVALALKHVNEHPVGLRVRRPEVPVELERLVQRLMAKSPADRYASAAEMLADLSRIRGAIQGGAATLMDENPVSPPSSSGLSLTSVGSGTPPSGLSKSLSRVAGQVIRPSMLLITALSFLAAGGVMGFLSRTASGSRGNPAGARMPGLELDPSWSAIPRRSSAEEQFRFAQLQASADEQGAAWLAVPGHHPQSHDWVSPAYLQLARRLYRQRDASRLTTLKSELSTWPAAATPDQDLVRVADCGIKLLSRDLEGVIEIGSWIAGGDDRARPLPRDEPKVFDPGLLEFTVEIIGDGIRLASQPGPQAGEVKRERLSAIQRRLMNFLRRVQVKEWAGR